MLFLVYILTLMTTYFQEKWIMIFKVRKGMYNWYNITTTNPEINGSPKTTLKRCLNSWSYVNFTDFQYVQFHHWPSYWSLKNKIRATSRDVALIFFCWLSTWLCRLGCTDTFIRYLRKQRNLYRIFLFLVLFIYFCLFVCFRLRSCTFFENGTKETNILHSASGCKV